MHDSTTEHFILLHIFQPMTAQRTKVQFASFHSDGFITALVVNPPERQQAKRVLVQRLGNVDCRSVLLLAERYEES